MNGCESARACEPRRGRTALIVDVESVVSALGRTEVVEAERLQLQRRLQVVANEMRGLCPECARHALPAHLKETTNA